MVIACALRNLRVALRHSIPAVDLLAAAAYSE
jgi:hypothetical protein